jgi:hypothetical protein
LHCFYLTKKLGNFRSCRVNLSWKFSTFLNFQLIFLN